MECCGGGKASFHQRNALHCLHILTRYLDWRVNLMDFVSDCNPQLGSGLCGHAVPDPAMDVQLLVCPVIFQRIDCADDRWFQVDVCSGGTCVLHGDQQC